MSAGGSKQGGSSSSQVAIPQFLEPFIRQSTGAAGTALAGLTDLIAPTSEVVYSGPPIPLNGVRGPSGQVFVDPGQNAFVDTMGRVIAPYQEGTVPGLIHGGNNPVRVVNGQVVGQGSSGQEELFSMPPGEIQFNGMADNLVAGFTPAQVAAQNLGISRAMPGGMFSGAQDAISGLAAAGIDTSPLSGLNLGLNPDVAATLSGLSSGSALPGQDALASMLGAGDLRGTDVLSMLSGQSGGAGFDNLANLAGQSGLQGMDALSGLLGGGVAGTSELSGLLGRGRLAGMDDLSAMGPVDLQTDTLSGLLGGAIPGVTSDALTATARGDFLYGGDAFDAAVDAAVRRATPSVLSTFGSAGAGGAGGGLAQEAIGRAAVDAFASQFGQERSNQLSAANLLGGLSLSDRGQQASIADNIARLNLAGQGQQADIAQALAGLDLSDRGQRAGIAEALGGLDLANTGQQADIAQSLAGLDLSDRNSQAQISEALAGLTLADRAQQGGFAESLAGLDLSGRAQQAGIAESLAGLGLQNNALSLDAANSLGQLGLTAGDQQLRQALGLVDADLGSAQAQLQASQLLPGLATADVDLLSRIGNIQQEQEQAQLDAPRNALLQLLTAALGGTPISSLLGENRQAQQRGVDAQLDLSQWLQPRT